MHRPAATASGYMAASASTAAGYMATSAATANQRYEIAVIRCGGFKSAWHLCLGRLQWDRQIKKHASQHNNRNC
jgi:hypothetical protein